MKGRWIFKTQIKRGRFSKSLTKSHWRISYHKSINSFETIFGKFEITVDRTNWKTVVCHLNQAKWQVLLRNHRRVKTTKVKEPLISPKPFEINGQSGKTNGKNAFGFRYRIRVSAREFPPRKRKSKTKSRTTNRDSNKSQLGHLFIWAFSFNSRHENTSDVYAKIIKRKKVFKGKGTREGKPINFVRGFSKPLHDQNALIIYALRYVNVPNLRIFHPFRTCARQNRFFSSNFFHRQREGGRRARENLML